MYSGRILAYKSSDRGFSKASNEILEPVQNLFNRV